MDRGRVGVPCVANVRRHVPQVHPFLGGGSTLPAVVVFQESAPLSGARSWKVGGAADMPMTGRRVADAGCLGGVAGANMVVSCWLFSRSSSSVLFLSLFLVSSSLACCHSLELPPLTAYCGIASCCHSRDLSSHALLLVLKA